MNNKFELTDTTKQFGDVVLHQIKALTSFSNVTSGNLGGWIEKEENLSQTGDAWVFDNAQVYDDAWIYGDAQVFGAAHVFDVAHVFGDAYVCGDAQIYGDAQVFGGSWEKSPLYVQGTKYSVCMYDSTHIKIGCQIHTFKEWLMHGHKISIENGFSEDEFEEYKLYVLLAIKRYAPDLLKLEEKK